ncbi:hypothetical protein [Mucilaginibacter sp. SP1R1]|uniref:hypothetical protein n=1 Tax=Mucilaginibacter sp. SP1R1 TaxID=2723091 RepID=UPI001618EC63|nr:hypothetical protein [Mucilaginibacter sp. SP1R1]MBB6147854.1 hypothetical protein [Mucilaginibacter sp. SP1R1]
MFKLLFLFLICCFITPVAFAQGGQKGTVYEIKTRVTLEGIRVENSKTGKYVITDKAGKFNIDAKSGDLLVFKASFYLPDTVLLTDLREREVFLTPKKTMLKEVKVTNTEITSKPATFQSPDFHGQTMVYQRDDKANYPNAVQENYKGGVAFRLSYWKKDENKRKKLEEMVHNDKVQQEIAQVFKPDNIGKYVPLKDTDLDNFILLYIPSVKTYTDKGFNLTNYLNESYKKYLELPPDKRTAGKLIDN